MSDWTTEPYWAYLSLFAGLFGGLDIMNVFGIIYYLKKFKDYGNEENS